LRKSLLKRRSTQLLLGALILFVCGAAAQRHPPLIDLPEGKIQDFAYYTALTDYFWRVHPGNLYSLDYQIEVYSRLFERTVDRPMPILWGPLAVIVLAPFLPLFPEHVELAHTLFVLISAAAFVGLGFVSFGGIPALIACAALLTPVTLESLVLGQPCVLAASLFGILFFIPALPPLLVALSAVVISVKPTYLAPFFCLLVAARRWRTIAGIGVLLGTLTLFIQYLSGGELIRSYFQTLAMFRLDPIPAPYNRSYDPTLMANLAMFLKPVLGWGNAYSVTMICFGACQVAAVIIALTLPRQKAIDLAPMLSAFGLLLFAPYVGWYEDILATPFIVRLWQGQRQKQGQKAFSCLDRSLAILTIIFFALLFRRIYVGDIERSVIFVARAVMLIGVLTLFIRAKGREEMNGQISPSAAC